MTVPAPRPSRVTLRVAVSKVAVTEASVVIGRSQVPVPVQAPDQPTNTALADGTAVSVTAVPGRYDSAQSVPQAIPAGELLTVPPPSPALATTSGRLLFPMRCAVAVERFGPPSALTVHKRRAGVTVRGYDGTADW